MGRQGRAHQLRGGHGQPARARAHRPDEHPLGGAQAAGGSEQYPGQGRDQGQGRRTLTPGPPSQPLRSAVREPAAAQRGGLLPPRQGLGQPADRRRQPAGQGGPGRAGADDLHRPALRHQVRQQLPALRRQARREGPQRCGPDAGARNDQGVSGYVGVGDSLVPLLSPRSPSAWSRTSCPIRWRLRSNRRRERSSCSCGSR